MSLRKELGELLVAAGLVGGALPLFESLELWDSLAVCYQLLGKKVQVRGGLCEGGCEGYCSISWCGGLLL